MLIRREGLNFYETAILACGIWGVCFDFGMWHRRSLTDRHLPLSQSVSQFHPAFTASEI